MDKQTNAREQNNETRPEFCICEEHAEFKDEHCEDCKREWEYYAYIGTNPETIRKMLQ